MLDETLRATLAQGRQTAEKGVETAEKFNDLAQELNIELADIQFFVKMIKKTDDAAQSAFGM